MARDDTGGPRLPAGAVSQEGLQQQAFVRGGPFPTILSSSMVNMAATGGKPLFECPRNARLIVTDILLREWTASLATAQLTFGTNATSYDDWSSSSVGTVLTVPLTNLTSTSADEWAWVSALSVYASNTYVAPPTAADTDWYVGRKIYRPGDEFHVNVSVAAAGTPTSCIMDVMGILLEV